MSVDYVSSGSVLDPAQAAEIVRRLAPRQRCGALVGANEQNLVDAWVGIADIHAARIAEQYGGGRPPEDFWENASVELDEEDLELLTHETCVITNRSSALAGLDRVLALPNGIALMSGHALAHIPLARIDTLELALSRLWWKLGGEKRAAALLQAYLYGNCNEDAAAQIITLVMDTLAQAKRDKRDALLISYVPG